VEGDQTYLGRSVACSEIGTERVVRLVIVWQKSAEGVVPASELVARHSSERRETAGAPSGRDNREGPNGLRKELIGAVSKDRIS